MIQVAKDEEQMTLEILDDPDNSKSSIQEIDLKHWITKSNVLVESTYKLSVQEQRILMVLSSKVQPSDEELKEYKFRILDFVDVIGAKSGAGYYSHIKEVVIGLQSKTLTYKEGNRTVVTNWLIKSIYADNEGLIILQFHPDLKRFFLQLKQRYTTYQLENVIQLDSIYSIRMYELLKQYQNMKEKKRIFTIESLRETLGIEKTKYAQYGHFKDKVIKPAQREMAEKTDIYFDFEEIKRGRKVDRICFYIKSKYKATETAEGKESGTGTVEGTPLPYLSEEEQQRDILRKKLLELEVKPKTVENLLKRFPMEHIQRNIQYVYETRDTVSTSLGGYTNKAIRDDYAKEGVKKAESPKRPQKGKPIRTELLPDWYNEKDEEQQRIQEEFSKNKRKQEYLEEETKVDFNAKLERMYEFYLRINKQNEEEAMNMTFEIVKEDYHKRKEFTLPHRFIKDFENKKIQSLYRAFLKEQKTSK